MITKRRLFRGEREIESVGTMTLTTHRVILRRWRCSLALLLEQVDATTVRVGLVWSTLTVRAGSAALVLRMPRRDAQRVRRMADRVDAVACGVDLLDGSG